MDITKLYTLPQWMLFFFIYCFLGWVWESAYVSVCQRRPVNRGFLKGPFLPIYGCGAICILAVTIPVRGNIPMMFVVGMVSASLLEYVTGAAMEKLFRVRYWDYSGKFLNLNGHICLLSTLCWGFMTLLMVDVIQVRIEPLVLCLGKRETGLILMIILPVLSADFATSFIAAIHLRDALVANDRIREELERMNARKLALEQELEKLRSAGGRTYGQVRDSLQSAGGKLQDVGGRTYGQVRDSLQSAGGKLQDAGGRTYGQVRENLQEAGEKLQGVSLKAYQQLREELQELYMRMGAYKERGKLVYTRSVRGLLRRNPSAVSRIHRESFAELKKNILERLEEIRR